MQPHMTLYILDLLGFPGDKRIFVNRSVRVTRLLYLRLGLVIFTSVTYFQLTLPPG